jgi:hypothetical protein
LPLAVRNSLQEYWAISSPASFHLDILGQQLLGPSMQMASNGSPLGIET